MSSSYDPSEHWDDGNSQDRPRNVIEERDSSPKESEATSRRLPSGPRVQVTARKSVLMPVRRSFRIPARDEAGPSRTRRRSPSSSPSRSRSRTPPPPPANRAMTVRPAGVTPVENYLLSGVSRNLRLHRTLLGHHDQTLDALMDMMDASGRTVNRVIGLMGHTMASIQRLYMMVYLLMTVVTILLGWVIYLTRL